MKILVINHASNTCFMRYAPRLNLELPKNDIVFKHELVILFRTDSNINTNFLESPKESPQTFCSKGTFMY